MGQKTCVPSFRDTKYKSLQTTGCVTACSAAAPGLAMGPGGSPFTVYVLYGCGVIRSCRLMFFTNFPRISIIA